MDYPNLTFEQPDRKTFKNLDLAFQALDRKGNAACVLNAANEVTVQAFLEDKIKFLDIADINQQTMEKGDFVAKPSYEDYVQTDKLARIRAQELVLSV
jgi:1-deoxy-D-xylulose-5-phosphate reductoisomerase